MQIYSAGAVELAIAAPPPPGPLTLPLWIVVARTDLHTLFLDFASQVYEGARFADTTLDFGFPLPNFTPLTSGLCRMMHYGWLKEFVTTTTNISGTTTSVYNSPVGSPAALFSTLKAVLATRPGSRLYTLIGIYHFVIWYLTKKTDTFGRLDAQVLGYIKQELAGHTYEDQNLNDTVVWTNPQAVPSGFEDAFKPSNSLRMFEFNMRPILAQLEFKKAKRPLSAFNTASDPDKFATRAALCSFIIKARELLSNTVHEETKAILEVIDPLLAADYKRTHILALGPGEETYGFFGLRNFGILFFDYELAGAKSKSPFDSDGKSQTSLDYLGIQKSAAYEVSGKDASSVFVTHIGMDDNFNSIFSGIGNPAVLNPFIPHVLIDRFGVSDRLISHEILYAVHNGISRFESGGTASVYNPSDSSLSVGDAECAQLNFSTNLESPPSTPVSLKKQSEEIAFFIMPNNVPPQPPDASASTFWLLPDNVFYDQNAIVNLFQGNPSNIADLDNVLDELLLSSNLVISGTLRGDGVGAILDPAEAPSGWESIVKASTQADVPKNKTLSTDNAQKRHARGTISVFHNGDYHLLRIDVVGFASPVRCTWKTAYPFYSKMKARIGNHVKRYDLDTAGDPWYNGPLSSFRAFGLLKGIVEALKNRITLRDPTGSDPTLNDIATELNDFVSKAFVGIKTRSGAWVKNMNGEDLVINEDVFTDVTTP